MVRQRKGSKSKGDKAKAEQQFAHGAERVTGLDPDAPRNFKGLSLHMNEYEYTRLMQAAQSADRRPVDFMRIAVKKAVTSEIGD